MNLNGFQLRFADGRSYIEPQISRSMIQFKRTIADNAITKIAVCTQIAYALFRFYPGFSCKITCHVIVNVTRRFTCESKNSTIAIIGYSITLS